MVNERFQILRLIDLSLSIWLSVCMRLNHIEIRNNEAINRIRSQAGTAQTFRNQRHFYWMRVADLILNAIHAC